MIEVNNNSIEFILGKFAIWCPRSIIYFALRICDLSRENVPYGIRSNGRTHGMWTDDKRIEKPFKTDAVNGWTASEKFRTVEVERLNG